MQCLALLPQSMQFTIFWTVSHSLLLKPSHLHTLILVSTVIDSNEFLVLTDFHTKSTNVFCCPMVCALTHCMSAFTNHSFISTLIRAHVVTSLCTLSNVLFNHTDNNVKQNPTIKIYKKMCSVAECNQAKNTDYTFVSYHCLIYYVWNYHGSAGNTCSDLLIIAHIICLTISVDCCKLLQDRLATAYLTEHWFHTKFSCITHHNTYH